MQLEIPVIQKEMGNAVTYHATQGDKQYYDNTDLMISTLQNKEDGLSIATKAWTPNKERLGRYNIAQITQMCKESGFITAYDAANEKAPFSKLLKGNKSTIIDGVIDFGFDWSIYAPSDYLALIS